MSRRGLFVAVLGVDGVGKSTVIGDVVGELMAASGVVCEVVHLRPGVLPALARLKGRSKEDVGPVVNPHAAIPSGVLLSLVRIFWLLADYHLGYWLRIRPFLRGASRVFVFDRYAYDMGIDPRRFRIGLSGRVSGWLARLVPTPDVIVCLHADSEVILRRKQELPKDEIRRQVDAIRKFAARHSRAVLVSTEAPREEVSQRVLEVLVALFNKQSRSRG